MQSPIKFYIRYFAIGVLVGLLLSLAIRQHIDYSKAYNNGFINGQYAGATQLAKLLIEKGRIK